jgi:hypothetical protein
MNVCEKNQPLAVFLRFSPEVPTRHSLYTNAKEKKEVYISYFCTEKNQSELCWFPAVSWVIYISFENARWNFVLCCIHTCMQTLSAVLKSVMKGKVKYVLSSVPYSLVNQLLVKNFKIFLSKNKIFTKLLVCLCCHVSYLNFYTVPTIISIISIILILYNESYWNKFPRFTGTKICAQQSLIICSLQREKKQYIETHLSAQLSVLLFMT